jgi:hypothetical protein
MSLRNCGLAMTIEMLLLSNMDTIQTTKSVGAM